MNSSPYVLACWAFFNLHKRKKNLRSLELPLIHVRQYHIFGKWILLCHKIGVFVLWQFDEKNYFLNRVNYLFMMTNSFAIIMRSMRCGSLITSCSHLSISEKIVPVFIWAFPIVDWTNTRNQINNTKVRNSLWLVRISFYLTQDRIHTF